ncbi:hypothetical protein [Sediminibacillus halophilus]|uniref:Uncharacterized protein n=1 Tax=Sediminibacillus halophilus TaxID=482461 RepID=A0A1G9VJQ4_9BACI|nr:hypothetical protein [Sediminibacillus halophilus]SDM72035.1 hypothetical protein SAMN05216244_3300 [Sediminibacillus halophilus]
MFTILIFLLSMFIILFTKQPNGRLRTGALVFAFFGCIWLTQWKDGEPSPFYFSASLAGLAYYLFHYWKWKRSRTQTEQKAS